MVGYLIGVLVGMVFCVLVLKLSIKETVVAGGISTIAGIFFHLQGWL